MSKSPLVSILVPIYNIEKYLARCLDSLVAQTLTDIEIVCVNDGSKDSSLEILKKYAEKDSRIVVVDKENGGLPTARNAGLDVARGEYVGFVDGDDFVNDNMFEVLYKKAKRENADIVVCGANPVPLDETTQQWLKDVLSPENTKIRAKHCLEALFEVRGVQPFLWRNLIRKSLIDKYSFRLDEKIVVGEDTAFQFKVFPMANKIVTISNKLYNYEWARPESIMNSIKFKDYSNRLEKHINMIKSIAESWRSLNLFDEKSSVLFFEWAIDFIYWDLIRVSCQDKSRLAKYFCSLMVEYGYYNSLANIEPWVRAHFVELSNMINHTFDTPKMSVVVVMNNSSDYIEGCLNSILSQTEKNIEILLYNNGADERTYRTAFEIFSKYPQISLRDSSWKPISEHYNDAIATAKGEYIMFVSPYDMLRSNTDIAEIIKSFEDNGDIDLVGCVVGEKSGVLDIKECQNGDYHKFAYRISKIRENAILFNDYALLIGRVFFTKYCMKSNSIYGVKDFLLRSENLKRGGIYATETELILKAVLWMLKIGKENDLKDLCNKISQWINSENAVRLISDSIAGYVIDKSALKNPKKDVHASIFSLLIEINRYVNLSVYESSMIKPLSRYISVRHEYLNGI